MNVPIIHVSQIIYNLYAFMPMIHTYAPFKEALWTRCAEEKVNTQFQEFQ